MVAWSVIASLIAASEIPMAEHKLGWGSTTISAFRSCAAPPCDSTMLFVESLGARTAAVPRIEDLDASARSLLADNQSYFGKSARGVVLVLERVSEQTLKDSSLVSLSYEQFVDGFRAYGGEIVTTFVNAVPISINGHVISERDTGRTPVTNRDLQACDAAGKIETVYSEQFDRRVELRRCHLVTQLVDPASETVLHQTQAAFNWTSGSGAVLSVAPQATDSTHFLFPGRSDRFGSSSSTPGRTLVQNVPLDLQGDNRRLSVSSFGGSDSTVAPFPATYINNSHIFSSHVSVLTDPNTFGWNETAVSLSSHERIAGLGNAVRNAPGLGLWAYRSPQDVSALRVYPFATNPNQCDESAGTYFANDVDICLNYSGTQAIDWSLTPIHEFGHHLTWSYGLNNSSSCDELATVEGLGDALALMLEWWRQGITASDNRFLSDPNIARYHSFSQTWYYPAVNRNKNFAKTGLKCSSGGPEPDSDTDKYAKGMAISQILWSLMNNRNCFVYWDGNSDECSIERITDASVSDAVAGERARQTLTLTMDNTGSNAPIHEFLQEWWWNLYHAHSYESVWQLRQLFLQHDVVLPRQAPIGVVDSVSYNGAALNAMLTIQGWACDKDTPANPERQQVHIYIGGVFMASTNADKPSEVQVAQACADPTLKPHRFTWSVPNTFVRTRVGSGSKSVDVYALDSDFRNGPNPNLSPGRTFNIRPY